MKQKTIIALTIIGALLVVTIGATFAYFAANNQNDGNDTNISVETESLGSILWTGTKVFNSYDLLPGQIGIQEFTVEKNSDSGVGIYEVDLAGVLPEEFGTDIEISLYKTTQPDTNNVTVNVADPTLENQQIYQEDTLNITGTPELVYQGPLQNNSQMILEQVDFDVTTLEKTTYYLGYHYKNNGNQDDQQGLTFSGTISVRLIGEKSTTSSSTAVDTILSLAESNPDQLVYDGTVDNNLRYIGADPNNYVTFNNETWRIIGVFNNIDDGLGNKETRLKIIRDEPIGQYSWDYDSNGSFDNDWTNSQLMNLLNNGAYYNRTTGSYYNNSTTATSVDFTSNGLTEEAKLMIENAVWNLGGAANYTSSSNGLASHWYGYERGTTVYTGRPTEWTGQIALLYPSDYGYATSGGSTGRETCLATALYNWNSISDCYNNDWLYHNNARWTLTPLSDYSDRVFNVNNYGYVSNNNAYFTYSAVSPAVYLSSNVRISGGTGEESNPFTLTVS